MLDLALPAAAMPRVHTIGFDRVKPTSTLAAQNKMQSRSVRSAIRPPLLQWSAMQLSHELSGRRSSKDFRSRSQRQLGQSRIDALRRCANTAAQDNRQRGITGRLLGGLASVRCKVDSNVL